MTEQIGQQQPSQENKHENCPFSRVSTNRQAQSQSIEQQIERLEEAVTQHADWELAPEHIYRDDGYSGAKLNHPGLDRINF
jgi:site-specific DNA recombinase